MRRTSRIATILSMNHSDSKIDADAAWVAVLKRDRAADGRFVTGVLTTGIYCRPSCAARHPKRAAFPISVGMTR